MADKPKTGAETLIERAENWTSLNGLPINIPGMRRLIAVIETDARGAADKQLRALHEAADQFEQATRGFGPNEAVVSANGADVRRLRAKLRSVLAETRH